MLDTNRSIQIEDLLSIPTILELQQIGDDEVKAFLMGIILTKLYEFYRTQSRKGIFSQKLQHLTLIEEAHRLLKNVFTDQTNEETTNIKGAAVETFSNMLSEIRAYGESIVIAEQIPSKISSDVIKNTNLKIVHRMVDEEERKIMGHSMNMNKEQSKYISTLEVGQASVYAEKADKPYLIEIPNFKGKVIKNGYSDQAIAKKYTTRFNKNFSELLFPFIGCNTCKVKGLCSNFRDKAKEMIEDKDLYLTFNRLFISTLIDSKFLKQGYSEISREVRKLLAPGNQEKEEETVYCVMLHALDKSIEQRGRLYFWQYKDSLALKGIFTKIIWHLIYQPEGFNNGSKEALLEQMSQEFKEHYKRISKKLWGPFSNCSFCEDICFFRYDTFLLLSDPITEESFNSIFSEKQYSWEESLQKAGSYSIFAARKIILSRDENVLKRVGLCYAAQKSAMHYFSTDDQNRLAKYVLEANIKEGG
jgi:hypothetical protein